MPAFGASSVEVLDEAAGTAEASRENTDGDEAEILGRKDIAAAFLHRALSYRNTFDPASGFASPRYKDGSFKKDLDPYQTYGEGFIEGNSWNFSFHVPHDPSRLMDCMGGEEVFRQRRTLRDGSPGEVLC